MNTKKQLFINMFWAIIATALNYGISFLMTPFITESIGIDAYGFVGLANNFVSYIDIIAIAINSFAARYIAIAYHNDDIEKTNSFFNSVIFANVILVLLVNIPGSFIIYKLEHLLTIPSELTVDVKILFFLVVVNYSINILGTCFSSIAFIKNRLDITYKNRGVSSLIYALILLFIIFTTKMHVYYLALANLFAAVFLFISNFYYSRKLIPEITINIKLFSPKSIRTVVSSGFWNSINSLGNTLNSGLDLLVTNQFLSSVAMGQVSVSKQFATFINAFASLAVNAFQPKQLECYAKNQKEKLISCLCISMKCIGIIGNTIFVVFLLVGKSFLTLWIPSQDINYIYSLCIIVMIGDVIVFGVKPLYYVFTLTDKLKSVCWITILMGTFNVLSMLFLLRNTQLGAYAVVITTMILNIFFQFGCTPYLAAKYLSINSSFFYKAVLKHITSCVVSSLIMIVVGKLVINNDVNDYITFFANCITITPLAFACCTLSELNTSELRFCLKKFINQINNRVHRSS